MTATLIPVYLDEYASNPAIFSIDPIPDDVELRNGKAYVIIGPAIGNTPDDTKTVEGRQVVRQITICTNAKGSADVVENAAERVRTLFHRYDDLVVTGFNVLIAKAAGPIVGPSDKYTYSRIVTVTLTMQAA